MVSLSDASKMSKFQAKSILEVFCLGEVGKVVKLVPKKMIVYAVFEEYEVNDYVSHLICKLFMKESSANEFKLEAELKSTYRKLYVEEITVC